METLIILGKMLLGMGALATIIWLSFRDYKSIRMLDIIGDFFINLGKFLENIEEYIGDIFRVLFITILLGLYIALCIAFPWFLLLLLVVPATSV